MQQIKSIPCVIPSMVRTLKDDFDFPNLKRAVWNLPLSFMSTVVISIELKGPDLVNFTMVFLNENNWPFVEYNKNNLIPS